MDILRGVIPAFQLGMRVLLAAFIATLMSALHSPGVGRASTVGTACFRIVNPEVRHSLNDELTWSGKFHFKNMPASQLGDDLYDYNTQFYNESERKIFEVRARDGLLIGSNGEPFTTDSDREMMFVVDPQGKIYIHQLNIGGRKNGRHHHSSFLSGGPVALAGGIRVVNGKVTSITNGSGHYSPAPPFLAQVFRYFRTLGVIAEGVLPKLHSGPAIDPELDFTLTDIQQLAVENLKADLQKFGYLKMFKHLPPINFQRLLEIAKNSNQIGITTLAAEITLKMDTSPEATDLNFQTSKQEFQVGMIVAVLTELPGSLERRRLAFKWINQFLAAKPKDIGLVEVVAGLVGRNIHVAPELEDGFIWILRTQPPETVLRLLSGNPNGVPLPRVFEEIEMEYQYKKFQSWPTSNRLPVVGFTLATAKHLMNNPVYRHRAEILAKQATEELTHIRDGVPERSSVWYEAVRYLH